MANFELHTVYIRAARSGTGSEWQALYVDGLSVAQDTTCCLEDYLKQQMADGNAPVVIDSFIEEFHVAGRFVEHYLKFNRLPNRLEE